MNTKTCFCPNCLAQVTCTGGTCPQCGFAIDSYTSLPHHLAPGSMVMQRYRVGRVLGEGGFGITYIGLDTVLNLKVAIKEFYMAGYVNRNNEASSTVFATLGEHRDLFNRNKEKFLSEARVLARFYEEPGIVGVRDFCEENGTAYIIMDFLDGKNLKEYLKDNGNLAPAQAVALLMPVMRSLQRVHADGIIHRDISPDNIMVLPDGRTKLLDFGAAREVSQTDIKSLSVILKPGYAPEEQYRSKGHQGPWTDVYALAATLYRCIVGCAPDDAMERMYRDQLPAPAQTPAACPIAISNVIMKGLAVRQPDRYQDIGSFLADLEKALQSPNDVNLAPDRRSVPDTERTVMAPPPVEQTIAADAPSRPAPDRTGAASAASAQPASPSAAPRAKSGNPRSEAAPSPGAGAALSRIPKWAFVLGAVVLVLIVALVSCLPKGGQNSQNSQNSQTAQTSSLYDNLTEEETLDMRTVTINGVSYTLPMTLQSLLDNGWLFENPDYETATLAPDQTTTFDTLLNEYGSFNYSLKNETLNTQPMSACTVTYLSFSEVNLNDNYLDETGNAVVLPGGLTFGATRQQVLQAFPTAAQGDSDITVETPSCKLIFTCYDDVLTSFQVFSYVAAAATPETATISPDRPAEYDDPTFVAAYTLPDYAVDTGTLQTGLPLTLEDLTGQGWTVERQPDYLPASRSAAVYLRYDTRTTMKVSAINYTANAILPAYGILNNVTFSSDLTDCIPAENAKLLYKGEVLAQIGQTDRNTLYQATQELGLSVELPYDNQLTIQAYEDREIWFVFDPDNILKSFTVRMPSTSSYEYESETDAAS